MGAISPGPSLVVVLRNTISGGRLQGVMTGIGHGIGLSIYAFIAVMGLSSIILSNENYFQTIQFTAIFAIGSPVAFDTKGTVLEALGLTSST